MVPPEADESYILPCRLKFSSLLLIRIAAYAIFHNGRNILAISGLLIVAVDNAHSCQAAVKSRPLRLVPRLDDFFPPSTTIASPIFDPVAGTREQAQAHLNASQASKHCKGPQQEIHTHFCTALEVRQDSDINAGLRSLIKFPSNLHPGLSAPRTSPLRLIGCHALDTSPSVCFKVGRTASCIGRGNIEWRRNSLSAYQSDSDLLLANLCSAYRSAAAIQSITCLPTCIHRRGARFEH